MAQALELRDKADIMFPAFGDQLFDLCFVARIFPLKLGMRMILVSVIYLCYDYINTKFCQLAYLPG
jgi:hypothetical protein